MISGILQYWEISNRNSGVELDGASIHLDSDSHADYINSIYCKRDSQVIPEIYTRKVGDEFSVAIKEDLYSEIFEKKSLKLEQYQLNNLLKLNSIKLHV